jgi:hypothetical protein
VGKVAQWAFPGGVLVDAEYWDVKAATAKTKDLMADPDVPAILVRTDYTFVGS